MVVYATSEPEEALLLGGYTALMNDGRVTQFGPTAEIYRNPNDLTSADVFSDPPINSAPLTKTGDMARLAGGVEWRLSGPAAALADGPYTVAIRPNHVTPEPAGRDAVALSGDVLLSELSGSESTAHFRFADNVWVSLAHGVHAYRIGEQHQFYLDPRRCMFFAPDGRHVA